MVEKNLGQEAYILILFFFLLNPSNAAYTLVGLHWMPLIHLRVSLFIEVNLIFQFLRSFRAVILFWFMFPWQMGIRFGSLHFMAHMIMLFMLIFGKNLMIWLVWVVKSGLLVAISMSLGGHGRNLTITQSHLVCILLTNEFLITNCEIFL